MVRECRNCSWSEFGACFAMARGRWSQTRPRRLKPRRERVAAVWTKKGPPCGSLQRRVFFELCCSAKASQGLTAGRPQALNTSQSGRSAALTREGPSAYGAKAPGRHGVPRSSRQSGDGTGRPRPAAMGGSMGDEGGGGDKSEASASPARRCGLTRTARGSRPVWPGRLQKKSRMSASSAARQAVLGAREVPE